MPRELIRITGEKELIKKLNILNSAVQHSIAKASVNKAIGPWIKGMKSRISNKESKEVRLSVGRLRPPKVYRSGVAVSLVGTRVYAKGYKDANKKLISSRNIAMRAKALEYGTKKVPAKPFVRPTFQALKAQTISMLFEEVGSRVDKKVAKLKK